MEILLFISWISLAIGVYRLLETFQQSPLAGDVQLRTKCDDLIDFSFYDGSELLRFLDAYSLLASLVF